MFADGLHGISCRCPTHHQKRVALIQSRRSVDLAEFPRKAKVQVLATWRCTSANPRCPLHTDTPPSRAQVVGRSPALVGGAALLSFARVCFRARPTVPVYVPECLRWGASFLRRKKPAFLSACSGGIACRPRFPATPGSSKPPMLDNLYYCFLFLFGFFSRIRILPDQTFGES